MFLRTKRSVAALAVSLFVFGGVAVAQQTQSAQTPAAATQQARRAGMGRRGMQRRAMPMLRILNQLNLTADQKQQARSIIQTNLQGTKTQRQEMRQLSQQWRQGTLTPEGLTRANELHKQLGESRKGVRTQLAGILTAEQKTKLEEIIKTRRANHELLGPRGQRPN